MSARFDVRVQPGAPRTGFRGRLADGTVKLAVTAPPEDGRAHEAVVAFLAEQLGVARRQVTIVRGLGSRSKTVDVEGFDAAELGRRLDAAIGGAD